MRIWGAARRPVPTYEKILQLDPGNLQVLARYAGATVCSRDDPLIGRLQQELANRSSSAADRASVGFALGRALDSCGQYEAAFAAYETANQLSRASGPPEIGRYDRRAEEEFIERIVTASPAAATSADRPTQYSDAAVDAKRTASDRLQPIFICGMFRSGSTLIEQLLASDPQITSGGELDILPRLVAERLAGFPESLAATSPDQLAKLATHYLSSLAQSFPRATWITDKRPDNFLYIGLIKRLFPTAKIVHTTRDPLDNCLSIFFLHLDQTLGYALDLMDIGHHYLQYARLMRHWKSLYGSDIIDVNYDAYVRNPEAEAKRLFALLDLEWSGQTHLEGAGANAVKTASVWQVREPVYQRSSGRSRNYARQLSALSTYLEGAST
jgi:hypothetical protein